MKEFMRLRAGVVVGTAQAQQPMPAVAGDDEWRECTPQQIERWRQGWPYIPSPDGDGVVEQGKPTQTLIEEVMAEVNGRIAASDWTQLADSPLSEEARGDWAAYRQLLREVPQQALYPSVVEWPEPPTS
ncbi:tail fiber assembly protein [Azohydromonas aeria]|uniref:tail fiber assembly protein n=1 Tax=Azohydromonas aeria TaxID=2590212 RepID=UPI0018DFB675|nr:tail fiber assembly protein [Azohydromonas aeria]